jgi:hypothetical protein
MKKSTVLTAAAAAMVAALSLSAPARAQYLLDTGTPATGASDYIFGASDFYGDEFYISAGETVTQLAAYLAPGTGSGTSFNFDIYSANAPLTEDTVGRLNNDGYLLYTTTATFTGTGWNTASANWTPTSSGDYWLVIEASKPTSLDVPSVVGQANGTAPAIAFADSSGTGGYLTATTTADAGMQISAVPLPGAVWLFGSGLMGLGGLAGRRRAA